MADTSIAITAGSGTSIDTRTEATNGNHRQVVVLGDPSTNAGVAPVDATAGLKVDLGADNDVIVSSGTITTVSTVTNLSQLGGAAVPIGAGVEATAVRVTLPTDGTGVVKLGAGTNGIGKLTANAGVTIGAVEIAAAQTLATVTTVSTVTGGGIAHDSADSGNPIKVGAKAKSTLSGVTLVASDDRSDATADIDGALIVRNNFALGDLVNGNASNTDGASTQVLAAGAAGIKHYITDVTITNTSASNIYVELKDGTTVKWTFPVPANGGVTHHFASPIGGTAATAWNFDPSAAATTIYCSVSGFKSKI